MQSYVFRLEKTNINNGDYSLFFKIGNEMENKVLNNQGEHFVSSDDKAIMNYMQIAASRLDEVNNLGEYDSCVMVKALLLQVKDDQFPLCVMQGDRLVSNDYAVDEFSRNFPSIPKHTIANMTPYYEVPKMKNQEKIESAMDQLVKVINEDSEDKVDMEKVVGLLQRKQQEQQEKKSKKTSGLKK